MRRSVLIWLSTGLVGVAVLVIAIFAGLRFLGSPPVVGSPNPDISQGHLQGGSSPLSPLAPGSTVDGGKFGGAPLSPKNAGTDDAANNAPGPDIGSSPSPQPAPVAPQQVPKSQVHPRPASETDAADKMKALRNAIEALPKGNIALRAPTKMTVGDQNEVKATVGFNVPMEALRKQLGPGPADQKLEGSLSLSPDMVASLNGSGFTIESTTPEQQSIAEGFPTVWSWNVTAKQEGEQELEATVYVLVGDGNKTTRIRVESFTQEINVSVRAQTWGEWLKSLGDELGAVNGILVALGGIITLVLGWLGIKKISPRKKKLPPKKPPK